jgi:hypothetical protein
MREVEIHVSHDLAAELRCVLCSDIEPKFSFGHGQDLPDYTLTFLVRRYFAYRGELAHLLHLCVLQSLVFCPGQYDLASRFPSAGLTYRSWRRENEVFLKCAACLLTE